MIPGRSFETIKTQKPAESLVQRYDSRYWDDLLTRILAGEGAQLQEPKQDHSVSGWHIWRCNEVRQLGDQALKITTRESLAGQLEIIYMEFEQDGQLSRCSLNYRVDNTLENVNERYKRGEHEFSFKTVFRRGGRLNLTREEHTHGLRRTLWYKHYRYDNSCERMVARRYMDSARFGYLDSKRLSIECLENPAEDVVNHRPVFVCSDECN